MYKGKENVMASNTNHQTKTVACSVGDKRKEYLCLHKKHKTFIVGVNFRSTPMPWLELARCRPTHTHFFLLLWSCRAVLGILWPCLHLLHFNLFLCLRLPASWSNPLACKFPLMAFQPLYSVSGSYKKAADIFRRGVVVPDIAQAGETTMKLEKSG